MNRSIKLCVEMRDLPADGSMDACAWMEGADALVIDPSRCSWELFESIPVARAVVLNGNPERDGSWRETADHWVCDHGLAATARLRDLHPELPWMPRLSVFRAQVSYRFSGAAVGEGFSFYMPDTSAIRGWQADGLSLETALQRAKALGFAGLWLHSPEAASRNRGLDLELLEKIRGGCGAVWLSGGVGDAGHLRNLMREGGASAVVVDGAVAQACSLATLGEALVADKPRVEATPMTFAPRNRGPRRH